jgi:cell division protein FtsI/penicillin-binding protein 2
MDSFSRSCDTMFLELATRRPPPSTRKWLRCSSRLPRNLRCVCFWSVFPFVQTVSFVQDVYTKFLTNQDKSRRMMEAACARSKELVAAMDKITDRNGSQRGV